MARGAMLIIELLAFLSLLLAIYYRTSVELFAMERQSDHEE
jgi:hypothetical protein